MELSLAQDEHFEFEEQNHLRLGELQLREWTDPVVAYARKIADLRKRRSSNQAKSKDDLYGLTTPGWKSINGHGLDHEANIEALSGKWVLLDFWGVDCLPCLKEGIPKLIEFYERNKSHKHRFEIISLYLDFTGRIDSVAGLQKELEPIEKYVWNGKKIPSPIVVDNAISNWERFGILGLGDTLLIDPEGLIVPGDLERLQEILNSEEQ